MLFPCAFIDYQGQIRYNLAKIYWPSLEKLVKASSDLVLVYRPGSGFASANDLVLNSLYSAKEIKYLLHLFKSVLIFNSVKSCCSLHSIVTFVNYAQNASCLMLKREKVNNLT